MMHAYDKLYLDCGRRSLAGMLDYAVHDLGYDLTEFFDLFIISGVADLFESGDVSIIAGRSGVELAFEVLDRSGIEYEHVQQVSTAGRSEEYWTGWALAYYQWETAMTFAEISIYVPVENVRAMYHPYHEMDIRQFAGRMNELIREHKKDTCLKILRLNAGLSQSALASASGVPVRTIQQYEQRRKNINKAQAEYLIMLAGALKCRPEDLMEKI